MRLLAILGILMSGTTNDITLRVYPSVSQSPAIIEVRIGIQESDLNRLLDIIIEGPEYYTHTSRQLSGITAPKHMSFTYRDLPMGEYLATAILNSTSRASQVFLVS